MAIKTYVLESLEEDVLPAAILTIHTSGQFLNFNPHIHGLVVTRGFRADGSFIECPAFDPRTITELFAPGVFLSAPRPRSHQPGSRRQGDVLAPQWLRCLFRSSHPQPGGDSHGGLYIVRPPVAASRLVLDDGPVVWYFAKGTVPGKDTLGLFDPESRTFDYLEWMARVTSHIPERGSHLVHYLGAYSNKHGACELAGAAESACTPVAAPSRSPRVLGTRHAADRGPASACLLRGTRRRCHRLLVQLIPLGTPK